MALGSRLIIRHLAEARKQVAFVLARLRRDEDRLFNRMADAAAESQAAKSLRDEGKGRISQYDVAYYDRQFDLKLFATEREWVKLVSDAKSRAGKIANQYNVMLSEIPEYAEMLAIVPRWRKGR